ncbi:MAG TPA: hypothetical protein VGC13_26905 [Longimicrobium sp.]
MRTRCWMRLALVLAALGTAGCGGGGTPSLGKPGPPVSVHVANDHFSDVTVYVVQSGMRWRLGMVTGLSRQRFTLPRVAHDAGDLRLLADPVGGAYGYLSPAVRVHAGETVDLRLHAELSMSSVSVWDR